VAQDRYADRLDASTYEDDDDTVGVFESRPDEQDSLWPSGRLFHRLTGVATATKDDAQLVADRLVKVVQDHLTL
jgi:hypothetical protein